MDKENNQEILSSFLKDLQFGGRLNRLSYRKGLGFYEMGQCHLMTSGIQEFSFEVQDDHQDFQVQIKFSKNNLQSDCSCKSDHLCSHVFASALQTQQEMSRSSLIVEEDAIKYSRGGMVKRVMEEREERAQKESYQLDFADNIYGEHHLVTKQAKDYYLSFYDFDRRLGYCSCPDYQTNKLETCKHLIYAFDEFLSNYQIADLPSQSYPFVEVFRHPLKEYQIAWFYPHDPDPKVKAILEEYFDEHQVFKKDHWHRFHQFLEQIQDFKSVKIRPEVKTFVAQYFELNSLSERFAKIEFPQNLLKQKLFKYQEEGSLFIAGKKGSIIADEIGLGKSVQALAAGLIKYKFLGFANIKILCPSHLKEHWKSEIEKWLPEDKKSIFQVVDFDEAKNHQQCDFLIIDEAQKIDDFQSGILYQLHHWDYQHILLITDSKLSTSLIKFYAMAALIDPYLLTPLWELSYKHCLFSSEDSNNIVGYYNLDQVYSRLENVYLRRNKSDVMEQLPPSDFIRIPVALNESLMKQQSQLAKKLLAYAKKDKLHHFDLMQFKSHLQQMIRMGQYCLMNAEEKYINPKLEEFIHFVNHKLNLQSNERVMIFVQSKTTQFQIQRLLQENRKPAKIIQNEKDGFDSNEPFIICEERMQKDLPQAHHFIYYHWPQPVHFLEERIKYQNETQVGLRLNRFYVLETNQSFDSIINRWQKEKPHFLHQMLQFTSQDKEVAELGLRLKEELVHELKNMILNDPKFNYFDDIGQMDLFEKPVMATDKMAQIDLNSEREPYQEFFEKLMELYSLFDGMEENEKESLKKSDISISNEKDEIIIKVKKP